MVSGPWTDAENDLIVADYFAMLQDNLAHRTYSKAEHNRALQAQVGRGKGAIEYKHQNISAVLVCLAQTWLPGYPPAFNFQTSLVDAVQRWLHRNPEFMAPTHDRRRLPGLMASAELFIGPPPTHSNQPLPAELDQIQAITGKFDVARRDEHNRALGRAGEERVLAHEYATLVTAGRTDLAKRVKWVSDAEGDGAGYDIASYSPEGRNRLIEVKTTNGWERTPFYITRNELTVSKERHDEWYLLRLWNFARAPKAFQLAPPLDAHVNLIETAFEARFP